MAASSEKRDFFYVAVWHGKKCTRLAGPYTTKTEASAALEFAREWSMKHRDPAGYYDYVIDKVADGSCQTRLGPVVTPKMVERMRAWEQERRGWAHYVRNHPEIAAGSRLFHAYEEVTRRLSEIQRAIDDKGIARLEPAQLAEEAKPPERLAEKDKDRGFEEEKPRAQWLDGTGLDGQPVKPPPTWDDLAQALRDVLPKSPPSLAAPRATLASQESQAEDRSHGR